MKLLFTLHVAPVPAPRMTQRDRWAKRNCVERYWEFRDAIKLLMPVEELPVPGIARFFVPMPRSWSKKKRAEHLHQPKLTRPDADNYEKALLDAIYENDATVWDFRAVKIWAEEGKIEIWEGDPMPAPT